MHWEVVLDPAAGARGGYRATSCACPLGHDHHPDGAPSSLHPTGAR